MSGPFQITAFLWNYRVISDMLAWETAIRRGWKYPREKETILTERIYDIGEVVLNVAEGGSTGTPLLRLPGGTLSWDSFRMFIP